MADIIKRIAETDYVRQAIADKADLTEFKQKPTIRILAGVAAIIVSYIICWPAIGVLGTLSIYYDRPLLVAVGGPLLYGLSHLVFLAGMYLAGEKYTKIFLRWATRVFMEKLLRNQSRPH
ncbi:MAG: hypothetical protein AB1427_10720 [Thermodesulfobacteriota bacterium]